jgi:hypothetical protein
VTKVIAAEPSHLSMRLTASGVSFWNRERREPPCDAPY